MHLDIKNSLKLICPKLNSYLLYLFLSQSASFQFITIPFFQLLGPEALEMSLILSLLSHPVFALKLREYIRNLNHFSPPHHHHSIPGLQQLLPGQLQQPFSWCLHFSLLASVVCSPHSSQRDHLILIQVRSQHMTARNLPFAAHLTPNPVFLTMPHQDCGIVCLSAPYLPFGHLKSLCLPHYTPVTVTSLFVKHTQHVLTWAFICIVLCLKYSSFCFSCGSFLPFRSSLKCYFCRQAFFSFGHLKQHSPLTLIPSACFTQLHGLDTIIYFSIYFSSCIREEKQINI